MNQYWNKLHNVMADRPQKTTDIKLAFDLLNLSPYDFGAESNWPGFVS